MTPSHRQYLMELFQAMSDAGFEQIRIETPGLWPYEVQTHGSIAVIDEMFSIDDIIVMTAVLPRPDGSDVKPMQLLFLLANDPGESLMDYTIPSAEADEKLSAILDKLEVKPL